SESGGRCQYQCRPQRVPCPPSLRASSHASFPSTGGGGHRKPSSNYSPADNPDTHYSPMVDTVPHWLREPRTPTRARRRRQPLRSVVSALIVSCGVNLFSFCHEHFFLPARERQFLHGHGQCRTRQLHCLVRVGGLLLEAGDERRAVLQHVLRGIAAVARLVVQNEHVNLVGDHRDPLVHLVSCLGINGLLQPACDGGCHVYRLH